MSEFKEDWAKDYVIPSSMFRVFIKAGDSHERVEVLKHIPRTTSEEREEIFKTGLPLYASELIDGMVVVQQSNPDVAFLVTKLRRVSNRPDVVLFVGVTSGYWVGTIKTHQDDLWFAKRITD